VAFVKECFGVEPDPWQADVLAAFPTHNRLAMKAAKGVGKTTVLAWIILNFLATRPEAQVAATSISGDNLKDGLWKECAKWLQRSPFLSAAFEWQKQRIVSKERPATWWASARQWSRSADVSAQSDTLSGLHSDFMMFVLDESSEIPQAVMTTAEAVLASGIECKVLQAGNPTKLTGPLYRACVTDRKLWHVVQINGDPDDPTRSPRINVEWARQQIESYGRENPWVMVNVLGQFPPASLNALLGPEEVQAAMRRHLPEPAYQWAQKRLGVDVARYGDDRTVIFPRQGLASFRPRVMRHARGSSVSTDIATAVLNAKQVWGSEVELLDATGGWGAGARDVLMTAGVSPIEVHFHAPAIDSRYANRRAEMWMLMAEWVKKGSALPPIPELVSELTEPTYLFNNGKLQLEGKDQIKARLGRSPDLADALALTFAIPEQPAAIMERLTGRAQTLTEFDPYEEWDLDDDGLEHPAAVQVRRSAAALRWRPRGRVRSVV